MAPCRVMSRAASAGASAAPVRKSIAPVMCIAAIALCSMLVSGANGQSICGPGSGDCCAANFSPGCDEAECCNMICAQEPFCCDVTWDALCASEAMVQCAVCQIPGACCFYDGDCLDNLGAAACLDAGGNPQGAFTDCDIIFCPDNCSPGAGACCLANGTPGCEDPDCCLLICMSDPFCCDVDWDGSCQLQACMMCAACHCLGACCFTNGECWTTDLPVTCSALGGFFQGFFTACEFVFCSEICGPDAGDCCNGNGSPGCSDSECCEAICLSDPFCCDVAWDALCAAAASAKCEACVPCPTCDAPLCSGDLTGDKAVGVADLLAMLGAWGPCTDGCPGCIGDVTCDGSVGVADLLALLGNWGDCPLLPATCGPGNGNCCGPGNATPGCSDVACCAAICAIDMFCCEVVWDFVCAGAARDICTTCVSDPCGPAGGGGDCCEAAPAGGAGCVDSPCCALVCAILPECCTDHWSETCAGIAAAKCAVCEQKLCVPGAGDCCIGGTTPGCDDPKCCDCVCAQDPFCCDTCWDNLCANAANNVCAASCPCVDPSCGPGAGDCCIGGTTPGCDDTECCTAICAQDPFCCNVRWDGLCAAAAINQCDVCQVPGACCFPDVSCQQTAGAAACSGLGGMFQGGGTDCDFVFCSDHCGRGDCCMPGGNGSPGCEDWECCQCVCALDPFCCDVLWDFLCAEQANGVCAGSCAWCE